MNSTAINLPRRLTSEGVGSFLLTATVVGSGIMAERLAGGNIAVALLANTGATVAVLAALIALLGPLSGAHFNPAVSFIEALRGKLTWTDAGAYLLIQILGCCAGALLAHLMFEVPVWQASAHIRTGPAQWLAEAVATFGLLLVMLGHRRAGDAPWMVASWIGAAYWFTASTSFANPAITIARSLSNTFSGIRPVDVPAFIVAQATGALAAWILARFMFPTAMVRPADSDVTVIPVTIYHNPACGTSRNVLALIRNAGVEPQVIEYLRTPPDRGTLESLLERMHLKPRALLREKGTPYVELGLVDHTLSDAQLLDAMMAHPILINRPIVVTPWGVKLCRPSEALLDILPIPQKGASR